MPVPVNRPPCCAVCALKLHAFAARAIYILVRSIAAFASTKRATNVLVVERVIRHYSLWHFSVLIVEPNNSFKPNATSGVGLTQVLAATRAIAAFAFAARHEAAASG